MVIDIGFCGNMWVMPSTCRPFLEQHHGEKRVETGVQAPYDKHPLFSTSKASCVVLDLLRSVFCPVFRTFFRLTILTFQDKHYRYYLPAGYITKRVSKLVDPLL